MRMDIQVKGEKKAAGEIDRMGDRAVNADAAFDKILAVLVQGQKSLWNRNGGSRWPALALSTQASKAAKGLDPRPMRATGALERSLTTKGGANQVWGTTNTQAEFGTKLFYGAFSQKGRGNQPKREILVINAPTRKAIREILENHLKGDVI